MQALRTLLAADDDATVLATLFDLEYLEARCRESIATLLADLAFILREAPKQLAADASFVHSSGARFGRNAVAILETVLSTHRKTLEVRPERLFALLYDELYWYDAPERAEHRRDAPPASEAASDHQAWRWAEHARAIFEARPGAAWLRRVRPPRLLDAALPSWRQGGEVRDVRGDGERAFVEAHGDLYLIDVRSGHVRSKFTRTDRGRFSPDGTHFVTGLGVTAGLWAADPVKALRALGPNAANLQRLVFSRDGRLVFTMVTRELRAWRVADGSCVTHATADYIDEVMLCGESAVVFYERGVGWQRWDGAGEPTRVADDVGVYHVVVVSPGGDRFVQQRSSANVLEGWDVASGTRLFQARSAFVMALAFHPSNASFIDSEGIVRDATSGRELRRLPSKTPHPSFDPTGRFLLTRHDDGAHLWDLATDAVIARVEIRPVGDFLARWSGDGRVLAMNEIGNAVMVDLGALAPAARWRDDVHAVGYYAKAQFSPGGATLVVGHEDGIGFWDTARGVIRTFADAAKYIGTFAEGCCVLGRQDDNTLIAFAIEDGVELWRTELPRGEGEYVYATETGVVLLERPAEEVIAFEIDDGARRYAVTRERVLACHRELFVTKTADGARVRSTATGDVVMELRTDAGNFAISPDLHWLAAGGSNVDLWDLKTRALHRTISTDARSLSFRADSAALIARDWVTQQSGNQDWNTEIVYDCETGSVISDEGYWDQDRKPGAPRELAPGIVLEETQVRVDGTAIALPIDPIVHRTERGDILVASVFGRRLELFALLGPVVRRPM